MYAEEYDESLHYQYCRKPHYLSRAILKDKHFANENSKWTGSLLWESITSRKAIYVEIKFKPETMEITRFKSSCDHNGYGGHYRSYYSDPVISRYDRANFRYAFTKYVMKEPQPED